MATLAIHGEAEGNITTLEKTFKDCGFIFRHCPKCKVEWLRWQALKPTYVEWSVNGSTYIESGVRLVAFAENAQELINRLAHQGTSRWKALCCACG